MWQIYSRVWVIVVFFTEFLQNNQRNNQPFSSSFQRLFKRKQKIKSTKKSWYIQTHTHNAMWIVLREFFSFAPRTKSVLVSYDSTFFSVVLTTTHMIRIKRKYTNGNGVLKKSTRNANTSFLRHNLQFFFVVVVVFLFCFPSFNGGWSTFQGNWRVWHFWQFFAFFLFTCSVVDVWAQKSAYTFNGEKTI